MFVLRLPYFPSVAASVFSSITDVIMRSQLCHSSHKRDMRCRSQQILQQKMEPRTRNTVREYNLILSFLSITNFCQNYSSVRNVIYTPYYSSSPYSELVVGRLIKRTLALELYDVMFTAAFTLISALRVALMIRLYKNVCYYNTLYLRL